MSSERSIYLQTVPIREAVATLKQHLDRDQLAGTERVPTHEAAGRTTAAPVYARQSSPTYHSAAMDGIAVRAEHTFAAREGSPVELKRGEHYRPVNTGDPLPDGADAVIMIEHVDQPDEETASIEAPAFPWQHVRRIGEDIVATELILPQNHVLSPYDVGALLSGGIWEVETVERPRVHIIPTGDEVLDFRSRPEPGPGQVIESNSQVLASLARGLGCEVASVPPVPDTEEDVARAVEQGLDSPAHAVIVCAGSSAGSKDYTRKAMQRYGRVLVHGIAAMPGKPSLLGTARGKLLVGAPGYPVSSVVCFEQLVQPLLAWLFRLRPPQRPAVDLRLTRKMPSKLGQEEFLRLSVGKVGDAYVGTPLARGAGLITSLTRAQGLARIPSDSEGEEAGRSVRAELLVPESELERILICVGSHDNTLDLLANELMGLEDPLTLSSTHVGSMGGISALKSGTTLLAGAHLFDPGSGDFNFPFLSKYLPGQEVHVVNLAVRRQGLIVAPGNPSGIGGLEDLTRSGLRFINRQRSAGTRILLDDRLRKAGIDPLDIRGYDQEEYTHMAVAANVLSGAADCGMGIHAAARALGLDFVPLARERFDLLIPARFADDPKIGTLLGLIRSGELQRKIEGLGGYETYLTGRVMQPGDGLLRD
jgi:putative molybdopterin biosynthesis protein